MVIGILRMEVLVDVDAIVVAVDIERIAVVNVVYLRPFHRRFNLNL